MGAEEPDGSCMSRWWVHVLVAFVCWAFTLNYIYRSVTLNHSQPHLTNCTPIDLATCSGQDHFCASFVGLDKSAILCELAVATAGKGQPSWCMATFCDSEDKHISADIRRSGEYGRYKLFGAILATLPEHMFLDAGANIGFHTLQAAKMTSCKVVAFEPNPITANLLRHSLLLNCLASDVELVDKAIGDFSGGPLRMSVHHDSPGMTTFANLTQLSSRVDALASHRFGGDGYAFDVNVTTIDAELLRLQPSLTSRPACSGRISLLKIDVEGFEEFVLRGAQRLLRINSSARAQFPFAPPLFLEIEVFPVMMHSSGSSPTRTLRMLGQRYDLFVGRKVEHMGLHLVHTGTYVLKSSDVDNIDKFVAAIGIQAVHVDVLGQLRLDNGSPAVPDILNVWNPTNILSDKI